MSALPPGPRGPSMLHTLGWVARTGPWSQRLRARYGDAFTLHVDRTVPWVVVSHPDAVRQVFTGDPDVLHAGEGNAVLRPLLGPRSLLLLDGPEHMAERKALLPSFHGERIHAFGELITEIAEREVASWPVGEPLAVRPRMQALTLEVIMSAVFGIRDQRLRERLRTMLEWTSDPLRLLLVVLAGPARLDRSFQRVSEPVDALLLEQIARRRAAGDCGERSDVLSLLLADPAVTDEQLRDELITLLIAGHETTATALAWALERLARHPDAWRELRGGSEEYLDAVVKETLRLRPVVAVVMRRVKAPVEIAGWPLPEGVAVVTSIVLVHTRSDVYPDPFAFRPERFLSQPAGTYTWIPFGGGVRRCLGASFAQFEMKAVLRAIVAEVERLEPDRAASEPATRRAVTLTPARGARIIVARRTATARPVPPVPSGR